MVENKHLREQTHGRTQIHVPAEATSAYPLPPYRFRDAHMYTARLRVDARDLTGILPQHLYPAPGLEDIVTVSFNAFAAPENHIRPYNELVIGMPAVLRTPAREVAGHYMIQVFIGFRRSHRAVLTGIDTPIKRVERNG